MRLLVFDISLYRNSAVILLVEVVVVGKIHRNKDSRKPGRAVISERSSVTYDQPWNPGHTGRVTHNLHNINVL